MRPHIADEPEDGGAPRRAGRYVLGRVLGAGAMGVVRTSYDPVLDRDVAVKLIGGPDAGAIPDTDDEDETKSQLVRQADSARPPTSADLNDAQLLAEAQALARVAHPNIVEVFDVGVCEAGVFIAMELVDGVPLRAWNEAHAPSWRTAVELHLPAGEALAAAHRVGIVHGDFKPDNVLVGSDGRVKVVDFGLARAISRFEPIPSDPESEGRPSTVFGTPAYLAPECWADARRSAASDQFAFFVALFEAIAGRRPFRRSGSLGGLLMQMSGGVDPRALDGFAPARLVRAIVRGLDPDPARRFEEMPHALAELRAILAEDLTRRSQRRLAAAGLAVAVPILGVAVGVPMWSAWRERSAIEACEVGADAIARDWDDAARERIRAAFVAAEPTKAEAEIARVMPWLDRYVARWTELRVATCSRAATESTGISATEQARERCFSERRAAFAALVEVLELADARLVRDAVRSAVDLPSVETCDDETWLALRVSLPDEVPEQVAEVERSLARADQLTAAGRSEAALEIADAALATAAELPWTPLLAPAGSSRGRALVKLARYDEAERELEAAYFHADEAADDAMRAETATDLAQLVGTKLNRVDDGLAWARHAETALAAIGGPETELHARLAIATATIHTRGGALEQGIAQAERAREIQVRLLGADHPSVATPELVIGAALAQLDRRMEALGHFDRAREILEAAYGPEHPSLAPVLHNLGMSNLQLERYEEARQLFARALAIREASLPADHPDIATTLEGLAYVALGLHRFDEAKRGFERSLAIREAKLGRDHPAVADTLGNLAQVADKRGECREVIELMERAMEIAETAQDPRRKVRFGLNLADALLECHEPARARTRYEAARALAETNAEAFEAELARANAGIVAARSSP